METNLAIAKSGKRQKAAIYEINNKLFEKNIIWELDFICSGCDVESVNARDS